MIPPIRTHSDNFGFQFDSFADTAEDSRLCVQDIYTWLVRQTFTGDNKYRGLKICLTVTHPDVED